MGIGRNSLRRRSRGRQFQQSAARRTGLGATSAVGGRWRALAVVIVALVVASTAPSEASTQRNSRDRAGDLGLSCVNATSGDWLRPTVDFVRCTGEIPSFDGVPLDVTLTLPKVATTGRLPVVLHLGGWPGHKVDANAVDYGHWWPGASYWNNVWWASRGYASLTYTARGFYNSCGMKDLGPRCAAGHTQIADATAEVRDSQYLLGTLIDARIADPGGIVATGESYGAGQTWMLATSGPWRSPGGHPVNLAGAIPIIGWSDLHGSLLPNGRANDEGLPRSPGEEPIGVLKQEYVSGFHAIGRSPTPVPPALSLNPKDGPNGRYGSDPGDKSSYFDGAVATWSAGEPYGGDARAYEQAWRTKSPLYNEKFFEGVRAGTVDRVPVFAVSGWFDALFPAVEHLQMYRKLLAADPAYPISLAFADIGHDRAVGPPQWQQILTHANAFLDTILSGGVPPSDVRSLSSGCDDPDTSWTVAPSWDTIRNDRLELSASPTASGSTTSSAVSPHAKPCRDQQPGTGSALWSWAVPGGATMLGLPTLKVGFQLTGGDATVIAKLWDIGQDGKRVFVTRGVYRLSTNDNVASGVLEFQLFGNHWHFAPGHRIELELTQSEPPYLRPDNLPSSITYGAPALTLPLGSP